MTTKTSTVEKIFFRTFDRRLSEYKFWRKWRRGTWWYVRPYDNLYSFTHMRYWINRDPLYNEVILKLEVYT